MSENVPHEHKVPSDLVQIPIVWRYELLKYLRSRRLIGSIAIAFLVVGLIYLLPPAFGNPYSGIDTGSTVDIFSIGSVRMPGLPFGSIGLLNHTGIDESTLTVAINGTQAQRGVTWFIAGENGTPSVNFLGADVVLLFTDNLQGSNVTASFSWTTPPENFEQTFLLFANILVVICATFFGADAIVGEYQNRTGYLMFPNPIKRSTVFFGKYAASITAGILVITLFYAAIVLLSFITVGGLANGIGLSYMFALEYLAAVMAIAYLVSSILKGTTGATVLVFFLFLLILPIVDNVSAVSGVKISASVTFSAGVIQYIIRHPYPVAESFSQGPITLHLFYPDPAIAALTMLAYTVIAIAISLVLFKRKELAG